MKSLRDYFGEYRVANKRRRRAHRDRRSEEILEAVERDYWRTREALKSARARAYERSR